METQEILIEDELHNRIKTLTHQSLLSLLRTYDYDSKLFDGSVQTTGSTKGTYRDSSLVLLALERAIEGMSRDKLTAKSAIGSDKGAWNNFQEGLEQKLTRFKQGKPESVSYDVYRTVVFEPTLNKISGGKPKEILAK